MVRCERERRPIQSLSQVCPKTNKGKTQEALILHIHRVFIKWFNSKASWCTWMIPSLYGYLDLNGGKMDDNFSSSFVKKVAPETDKVT
jgi:hypothetical protein